MRPVDKTISMSAGDVDGLALAQVVNGAATLNGALVAGGVGTFATARRIDVTGVAGVTAVNFTVTGTNQHGNEITETFLGPAGATTTRSLNVFKTITAVSTDGTTTNNVTVGEADETTTGWIPLDHYQQDFNVRISVSLVDAAALTWGVEFTLSDVQAVGFKEGDAIVADVADTNLLALASAAHDGTVTAVCEAVRAVITGHTAGGIRFQLQQAGY